VSHTSVGALAKNENDDNIENYMKNKRVMLAVNRSTVAT